MLKFSVALATAAVLTASVPSFGTAQAIPIGTTNGLRTTVDGLTIIENAQYVSNGHPYCWYDDGWNGAGWYRCGYARHEGQGWGGPQGWHDWHWQGHHMHMRHHHWRHHYDGHGCCW